MRSRTTTGPAAVLGLDDANISKSQAEDFAYALRDALAHSDVVLAIIGPGLVDC